MSFGGKIEWSKGSHFSNPPPGLALFVILVLEKSECHPDAGAPPRPRRLTRLPESSASGAAAVDSPLTPSDTSRTRCSISFCTVINS